MITFLANLLRNQNIYATKIIEYCSILSEFFLYTKIRSLRLLQKYLKIQENKYRSIVLRQFIVNYCQFMDIFSADATLRLGIAR